MNTFRINTAAAFFLIIPLLSRSVDAQVFQFQTYSMAEGLPSNTVLALCQDSRGFLWIGTDEGITIYDGSHFHNITTVSGIPLGRVSALSESKTIPGEMWFGMHGGGVAKYRNGSVTLIRKTGNQAGNTVDGLIEDRKGVIWIVSHGGIFHVTGDSLSPFLRTSTYTGGDVTMTSDGTVWAGIDHTLYYYVSDSLGGTIQLDTPPAATIVSMLGDRHGNLWVGTESGFLFQFANGKITSQRKLGSGGVAALLEEDNGDMLASVWGEGVYLLHSTGTSYRASKQYSMENGLRENTLGALFIDREGNLWLGSENIGLMKLSEPSFYRIYLPGLRTHQTGFVDKDDHFWFTGTGGLWELWRTDDQWREHLHRFPTIEGEAAQLRHDTSDHLWIGFDSGILARFTIVRGVAGPSTLMLRERLLPGIDIPRGIPLLLFIDSKNRIWHSYQPDPLIVLERKDKYIVEKKFTVAENYPVNSVRIPFEDRQGNLWFGTFSEGLSVLPKGDWQHEQFMTVTTKEGLPDNGIRSLFQDVNGTLWIGLRHGGIASIGGFGIEPLTAVREGRPFRVFNRSNGLLSNAVWDIAADETGRLWCATSAGVQYIIVDTTVQVAGLSEFTGYTTGTVGVQRNLSVWALAHDSFIVYDFPPEARKTIPPPIYITRVIAAGKELETTSQVELASHQNSVTIEFVGISFRQEQLVRYQYRLLDDQTDWQPSTYHNQVTYAGLSPGRYTFEVRAINSKGIFSESPSSFAFSVLAPVYQRWWFISLVLAALISLTAVLVWARARHLLAIERIRSRIATDLHDDIGASLTRIAVFGTAAQQELKQPPSEELLPSSSRLQSLLTEITTTSRDLTDAMSDVVWSVDPRNDSFDSLLLRMKTYAGRVLEARGIEYDVNIPPSVATLELPLDFRRNFLMVFKEALNNALRHSGASHIDLSMRKADDQLVMTIADNGVGFDESIVRPGNGLVNMRKRSLSINGHLEISAKNGEGSRITLRARIP